MKTVVACSLLVSRKDFYRTSKYANRIILRNVVLMWMVDIW